MNLENKEHSETFLKFYNWLTDDQDSSAQNASTYLKILRLFSIDVGCKRLDKITKEDVIAFLDKRKKSVEVDPEKKWQRTWNDYLARLTGFYKWFSNQDSETSRDEWETPEPIKSIKKKKNRRYSSYSPNDDSSGFMLLVLISLFSTYVKSYMIPNSNIVTNSKAAMIIKSLVFILLPKSRTD